MTQTSSSPSPATAQIPHSSWHSPIPFLFGGLGAMLALITFALLILACSYLKLSGYNDDSNGEEQDGEGKQSDNGAKPAVGFVEQYVVIMAGDKKPMFLATPIASRAASSSEKTAKDEEREKPDGSASRVGGDLAEELKNCSGQEEAQPDLEQGL